MDPGKPWTLESSLSRFFQTRCVRQLFFDVSGTVGLFKMLQVTFCPSTSSGDTLMSC